MMEGLQLGNSSSCKCILQVCQLSQVHFPPSLLSYHLEHGYGMSLCCRILSWTELVNRTGLSISLGAWKICCRLDHHPMWGSYFLCRPLCLCSFGTLGGAAAVTEHASTGA